MTAPLHGWNSPAPPPAPRHDCPRSPPIRRPCAEARDSAPIVQTVAGARLRALHGAAQANNAAPAEILAAALLRALAGWCAGPVGLCLIDDAPAVQIGQFTRLRPLTFDALPADARGSLHALRAALGEAAPLGHDPRELPAGLAVLSWQSQPDFGGIWHGGPERPVPTAPALHLAATCHGDRLDLCWTHDPARLPAATVGRLAARVLADLGTTMPPARGSGDKLDRLKARLTHSQGRPR